MKTHTDEVAAAAKEVELSRERLAETQEKVVKPLSRYAERNNFAALIAQSLAQGHHAARPH